ncbi:hypothetical protein AHF37_03746 [Paragonimus kellicotti]|nr:hypothetical protein AHF37_03746 [Paragonimus kellicotti]
MVCGHKSFCHIFSFKEDIKFLAGHVYTYSCIACLYELVHNQCISRMDKQKYLRMFYELSQKEYLFVDNLEKVTRILLNAIDMLAIDLNSDSSEYVDTVMAVLQFFFKLLSANEDFMLCGINSIFTLIQLDSTAFNESRLLNSIILVQKVFEIADTSWNRLPNEICEFFIMHLSSKFENVIVACFQGLEVCSRSPAFFQSFGLNSFDKVVDAIVTLRKNNVAVNNGVNFLLQLAYRKDCFELFTYSEKFGKLMRLLLNSHKCEVQHAVVNFLWVLLKNDEGNFCAHYLYVTGILEFLYDMLTPRKPYLDELHDILEVFGSRDEWNTSSLLPQVLDRFINVMEYLLEKNSPLIVKYCTLLCENIRNYRGVVDLFVTSQMQEKFLTLIKELLLNHNIHVCLSAVTCISLVMRCDRFICPVPVLLAIKIIQAASKSVDHCLLLKSGSKEDTTSKEVTNDTIKKQKSSFLNLYMEFCFLAHQKNLLRSKSLLSSKDTFIHTERNLERSLSTLPEINPGIFMDECIYLELIALMTLMEATKVYEGYGHKLKNDGETDEILQTFEILKQGASFIQDYVILVLAADYYSLAEYLRGDSSNFSPDHIAATALGITCTLMNRSIKFFQLKLFPNRKAYYEATEGHYSLVNRLCVPETLLEQLLLFPVKAGVAYFLTLPVFFTIQLLLTYTVSSEISMDRHRQIDKFIQTFENHFLTRLDISPVGRKMTLTNSWNVLASALVDRLTPHRTQLLLRCPGFSAQLQRADLVWVKLAQQMVTAYRLVMHCHSDDELYEQNASELLQKSYMSAANIWTVWVNTFIKEENELLLKRLTTTLENMMVALQRNEELSEEIRLSRREFTFYVADSLASLSTHLPCTLTEFLTHRDVYLDKYVEILGCFTEALIKELCLDAPRALRWIQLIFELLSNATCLGNDGTRHRLLKLILRFLINSEDLLLVQVVKLLCSSLCVHDTLHCFYVEADFGDNESVLSFHAQRYSISPEELESIMCIGAMVTGCCRALPPVQFVSQFDKAIFLHSGVILDILKSSVPSLANTQKIQAAALMCLLHSSDIPACDTLWPSCDSEEHVNYYCELALCLYTFIMDPVEEFLRHLSIRTYDVLLSKTICSPEASFDIGNHLIHSPWNSILVEQLQAATIDEDSLYRSVHFVDFVTALVRTNNPQVLLLVEKRILVRLLISYAHSELLECTDNTLNSLRKFAFEISKADNLGLLSEAEHVCIQTKLQLDSKPNLTPNILDLFRSFLNQSSAA